jgi:hypothetical protein
MNIPNTAAITVGLGMIIVFLLYKQLDGINPRVGSILQAGLIIIIIGGSLNFLVMMFNGGTMPVLSDNVIEDTNIHHFAEWETANLPILSDWINIKIGFASIGDIIVLFGIMIIFISILFFRRIKSSSKENLHRKNF